MNRKIELKLKNGCNHCTPKIEKLERILEDFENGRLPKDVKMTLELNSDWLGEFCWHLNEVTVMERKGEEVSE